MITYMRWTFSHVSVWLQSVQRRSERLQHRDGNRGGVGSCQPQPKPASNNTEGTSFIHSSTHPLHVTCPCRWSLWASHKCVTIRWLEADGVPFVPPGERRRVGVPAVAQRAEPVLLQAADEPCPLSIFLPGLLARNARACPHVPLWCPVARSHRETTAFLCILYSTVQLARTQQLERPLMSPGK